MNKTTYINFRNSFDAAQSTSEKIDLLWGFSEIYWDCFRTELSQLLEAELQFCIANNHLDGEIIYRVLLSRIYADSLRFDKTMEHVTLVREKLHMVQDMKVVAYSKMFFSIMEMYLGNYDGAFDLVLQATQDYGEFEDHQNYGWCHYTLGIIYSDLKDYENAEIKFQFAKNHFARNNYKYGMARCETGIATIKIKQDKLEEAEELFLKSAVIFDELEVSSGSSRVCNDLGELYKKRGEYDKAIQFLKKAISIRRETEHWQGLASSLIEIGDVLTFISQQQEAVGYLNEAIDICRKINNRLKLSRAHFLLYQIYRKGNDADSAIRHLEEYHRLKDEVTNVDSSNKIKALEKKMAAQKAEKEAEIERIRNVELRLAFEMIEEKNKEILDSINYAKRIQYTLLASDEVLKKFLPEHFVLFQPKDIVSGDFYWFAQNDEDKSFYLAVCDSTGHGVPGAFMSLLNITYLNEAINEKKMKDPGKILDHVREKLIKNISQDGAKDGMDATLIKFVFQDSKMKITYAAAHNSPFIVRGNEFIEMPFDKMPVGKSDLLNPFTTYEIESQQGDMIYLGTDGYADQFGGEKFGVKKAGGKKFKKSNLKKLLADVASSRLDIQNQKLCTAFSDWKGDLEQVDDVCIIGIRI